MDGALPLRPWVNAGGGEDDGTKEKQNPRRQDGCATGVLFFDYISFLPSSLANTSPCTSTIFAGP